jgi:hypothetical protein
LVAELVPTMYVSHPSQVLNEFFASKPYQGVPPEEARFLFVGLDANYAADIEDSPSFPEILAYHEDGPAFWREFGVHHPFLLPGYTGDGRRYHRTFAKIGFQPEHAEMVSFAELLHVPTVGRSSLVPTDLDASHLARLRAAIFSGTAKHIFLSAGVVRLMQATGRFRELGSPRPTAGALKTLFADSGRTVYLHLHFSNYGKFEAQLQAEAQEVYSLLEVS